ncbi:MAG: fructose-1,6-bisphosphatase [Eubacteriales bacterium]
MKHSTVSKTAYLRLLAKQYPSVSSASAEMIHLKSILNLPKGTEHFVSDIHGEYEAFLHLLNSASGVVREKIDELFHAELSTSERDFLGTLIYYPEEKLEALHAEQKDFSEWYRLSIHRLVRLCRLVGSKYTRAKVRLSFPRGFADVLDELIHVHGDDQDKRDYFENIISTIVEIDQGDAFLVALATSIKKLSVDVLHIVGDIYDRGPRADIIMTQLESHHNVDFQWGNHDILWMGAACGSRTLVATVLANTIHYNNLEVIEAGYGISLRPLALFAKEVYQGCDTHRFTVKLSASDLLTSSQKDVDLSAQMHKAITIILFKLEGQKLLRRPDFNMSDRLLLDKINYIDKTIIIDGVVYPLEDVDFPTVNPEDPYALTEEEEKVINQLTDAFLHSEKLQKHVHLLYKNGALYKVYNNNLLFHGCVPMTEDGNYLPFSIGCKNLSGKEFFDYAQTVARRAFYEKIGTKERQFGMDFLWFLWAGRDSPIFGRDRMTTFERRLIADESAWVEAKNPYYTYYQDPEVCKKILKDFGLETNHCHIINGHMPVKSSKGESPIKGGGRLIVIDGGFCKAYQPTTGIAGYTMIYNSQFYRLVSHEAFVGRKTAIENNWDIHSSSQIFERLESRMKIAETDDGKLLQQQVKDLEDLLEAYQTGLVQESFE